jgi:hypothetical protein
MRKDFFQSEEDRQQRKKSLQEDRTLKSCDEIDRVSF